MKITKWNADVLLALTTLCVADEGKEAPLSHIFVRKLMEAGGLDTGNLPPEKKERIQALLQHTDQAAEIIKRYENKGFQILLPDDRRWPIGLRKLGSKEPCYLFALGNCELLNAENRISIAGSRELGTAAAMTAQSLGILLAKHNCCMVSGCARGTDRVCQSAMLNAGGRAILFPAIPVHETMELQECKKAIEEERTVIVTETLPEEPFSASKALSRNHLIYAMGNPALVVAARTKKGGSWKGAMDCLCAKWSPVGVFIGDDPDFDGCRELKKYGAIGISAKGRNSDTWRKIQSIKTEEVIMEQLHF